MFSLYMAERLFRTSFSLIPLRGMKDSSAPKVPPIDWKIYQQRRAIKEQVTDWIAVQGWQLGVVTGRVSGVVVLDFDSMELWQRFSTEMPHIVRNKLIVRTKRAFHLYIPVATSGAPIPNKKGHKWELLADGRYAVAPGSEIAGHTYTILTGDLDQLPAPQPGQLKEILAWFEPASPTQQPAIIPTAQPTLPGIERDHKELIQAMRTRFSSMIDSSGGRNNALFSSLTWGRDRGLDHAECMALLGDFLNAPGAEETQAHRMREFDKTLRSAFSRPARPVDQGTAPARLPDSARQAFARRDLMHIWRLLDGLFMAGIRPGQVITRKQALACCGAMMGERNVWRALSDTKFFRRVEGKGSPAPTPNAYGVEPGTDESSEKEMDKCKYSRGKILQLNVHCNKGRPPHLYSIPSVEAVCRLLGISKPRWCSPIQHRSSKEARMALYYQKISHKPGRYANATLAGWFGVCAKTIKNYERELKIIRRPQYEEAPLASWNMESLPEPRMGVWLQQHGDRYPTIPALAQKLLKRGRVSLVKQLPNHISTAEYHQQQRAAAIARMRAVDAPSVQPTAAPEIAPKTPQKLVQKPVLVQGDEKALYSLFKPQKAVTPRVSADLEQQSALPLPDNGYPDDAMRVLKREWRNTAGSDWTVKSDRLELVQRVMPSAGKVMSDHQYGYLLDKTPRRMLMWLRKRVGDPLYTREDVQKLHRLMGGELTRKKAAEMFAQYGRAKTLRAAEFVSQKQGIQNKPAYLITCLRADARMAALMKD